MKKIGDLWLPEEEETFESGGMITDRIDRITHIPQSHLAEILPAPRSIKIELTAECQLRCFFCATSHGLRAKGHMDFDLFMRLVESFRIAGVEELGLFYLGESMLYPQLVEAVRYAKGVCKFPYVFLTTNGLLATPEKVTQLFYAGLDSLKFSFNSADGQQMRETTQVDAFDRVVNNIRAAWYRRDMVEDQTGHRCGLYASSILYEGAQREKMAAAVEKIKPFVDECYYLPLYSQHSLANEQIDEQGYVPTAGNMGRIGSLVPALPCWAVFCEAHVTWDGLLTACCFSHTDEFTMGDLRTTPFMEAWNSQAFQDLRKAHLAKNVAGTQCAACVAYA